MKTIPSSAPHSHRLASLLSAAARPTPAKLFARTTLVALALLAQLALAPSAFCASLTWDIDPTNTGPQDGSGNWDTTTTNWWNGAADIAWTNSNGDSAIFGSGGVGGTVTVGAGTIVSNITFNNSYTLSGNPLMLTNNATITTAAGTSNLLNLIVAGNAFTKEGPGTLTLNGGGSSTYNGTVVINNGRLQTGGNNTYAYINGNLVVNPNGRFAFPQSGSGAPILQSATLVANGGVIESLAQINFFIGTVVLDNNGLLQDDTGNSYMCPTNMDARSGRDFFARYRGSLNVFKSTAGGVIMTNRPNSQGTDLFAVTVNAGTLNFDKTGQTARRVGPTVTLGGGSLVFSNANASANPSSETSITSTVLKPGASSLLHTNTAGGGGVALAAITRNTGSTLDLNRVGTGNLSTTTASVNGILGGWATFAGTDWAAGLTIAPYAAYQTTADPTQWGALSNVSLSVSPSAPLNDTTNNSLRLTAASTVTINPGKTLSISSGGLLVTGSGATAITGGSLKGPAGGDLIVIQNSSADLTVSSTLADNSGSSLTKSGGGKLILQGVNNMTGANYLNGGAVEVSDLSLLASGPLVMNAGTLRYTGGTASSTRAVTVNGLGATFDVSNSGTTLTQSGAIAGSGAAFGDMGGLTKIGPGTLVLTASNYFNGGTVVSNGTLLVHGTNAFNPATWNAGNVAVYGGTLGGYGVINGSVAVKAGGTIAPGASIGTLTVGGNLTCEGGSTSLFEVTNSPGPSDLLVVQGNLVISNNATIAISVLGTTLTPGTNTVIQYSGQKIGSFNPVVSVVGGSINGSTFVDESTPGQIKLVLLPQVVIISQPADVIASTNDPVTFSVTATGSAPIGYQWYYTTDISIPSTPISGATAASCFIASADGTNDGFYSVVVSNISNTATSRQALLTVGNVCPHLFGPFDQTVIQGNDATFSTTVELANPYPTFQWQTNNVDVTGATTTSLTLHNVQYAALNGAKISVIASNAACMTTNSATLTVLIFPSFTVQPTNLTVNVGDPATFYVSATGVETPTLQWYKNGAVMPGQTNSTLSFASAQGSDVGLYKAVASNGAGSITSSVAKLTVLSITLTAAALAPANGAPAVCYDTPLYVTFNSPVSTVNSGRIRIFRADTTLVDTIDMGSNSVVISSGINLTNNIQPHSLFSGDAQVINYFPVIVSGNTAAIYPHSGVMTSNQTYYVTMDNGIVTDNSGAYFAGISDTNAWRFSTKVAGPLNPTNLVVAASGGGDFVTVQGAVDSIPSNNSRYTVINIRNGNYVEIVDISAKSNITFRGESRLGTVVGYPNNNNLTSTTAGRMAFKVDSSDIRIENLTLTNGTPQGGSQAETLLVYNNGYRCIVNNCDIVSRQDTVLINAGTSQAYLLNCRVVGNFDYVWGAGVGYFDQCVFHTLTNTLSGSYNWTAARTVTSSSQSAATPWPDPNGTTYSAYGFSFVRCTAESDTGVTGITLAGSNGTPGGLDSWALCRIDTNSYIGPSVTLSNQYIFWQYSNTDITGTYAISFTNVQTIGITNNDPRLLAATNPPTWFSGWTPLMAPNIVTGPVGQSVAAGGTISLNVSATGIPTPAYQWLKDGSPLSGQTGASLSIGGAHAGDAATYSVIVSNVAGVVTSSGAVVTVGNTAPSIGAISDETVNVGVTVSINVSNVTTDPDVPPQSLLFSLSSGPANASITPGTGVFSMRPLVSQGGGTYPITVTANDNGSPNLSGSQSFNVIVNPLTQPDIAIPSGAGSFTVSGQTGPDYAVQASTNLMNWDTIFATNSPAMPFQWTDPNVGTYPVRFYRIIVGPPLP